MNIIDVYILCRPIESGEVKVNCEKFRTCNFDLNLLGTEMKNENIDKNVFQ